MSGVHFRVKITKLRWLGNASTLSHCVLPMRHLLGAKQEAFRIHSATAVRKKIIITNN